MNNYVCVWKCAGGGARIKERLKKKTDDGNEPNELSELRED